MQKYQNIAPAPAESPAPPQAPSTFDSQSQKLAYESKMRKYLASRGGAPFSVDQTQSVQRRNARERNRVKEVNNSFARLRQRIPQTIIADLTKGGGRGPHKKISKVDTLRIAVEYIRRLHDLLSDCKRDSSDSSSNYCNIDYKNIDSTSNSSFGSFLNSGSSMSATSSPPPPPAPTPSPAPIAATAAVSPATSAAAAALYYSSIPMNVLPSFQQTLHKHQPQQQEQQHQPPEFLPITALLTPVSLHSYSPPQTQLYSTPATTSGSTGSNIDASGCPISPTSSFKSSMSFDSGTFEATPAEQQQLQRQQRLSPILNSTTARSVDDTPHHVNAHLQLKYEPYDTFNLHEEDCAPDDEEILDYISMWQEQ